MPRHDTSRIFIGGFSQGCQVVLASFLIYSLSTPLGGIIGLSVMNRLAVKAEDKIDDQLKVMGQTPMFLYHGIPDKIINIKSAKASCKIFQDKVYTGENKNNFTFIENETIGHNIDKTELDALKQWLQIQFEGI